MRVTMSHRITIPKPRTCCDRRYIIVAPTVHRAMLWLKTAHPNANPARCLCVTTIHTVQMVRGLRPGGPFELRIIDWPHDPKVADAIRQELRYGGWI